MKTVFLNEKIMKMTHHGTTTIMVIGILVSGILSVLAFLPVACCASSFIHWHFSIAILSGNITGIGILGYGVLVIGFKLWHFAWILRS